MNEKFIKNEKDYDEIEIDLSRLWKEIKKYWRLIILSTISLMIVMVVFTFFFIPKKYESESRIYLTPKINEGTGMVDISSITVNNSLVSSYVKMITGNNVLEKVAEQLNVELEEIENSVKVTNDAGTQLILINAKTKDPQLSKDIAETIVTVFSNEMQEKLNLENITIIDYAKVPKKPVSPSKTKYGLLGAIIGFLLSCGYIFIKVVLDNRLRTKNDAETYLGIPVFVEIPYFED